jgi:hypothetical protein
MSDWDTILPTDELNYGPLDWCFAPSTRKDNPAVEIAGENESFFVEIGQLRKLVNEVDDVTPNTRVQAAYDAGYDAAAKVAQEKWNPERERIAAHREGLGTGMATGEREGREVGRNDAIGYLTKQADYYAGFSRPDWKIVAVLRGIVLKLKGERDEP